MKKYFTLLFSIFITGTALAQSSFLDPSFGSGGIVITPPPMATVYSSGGFSAVAMQPDNKIIAVGTADEYVIVAKYNEDGTLDSTFGVDGIFKGGPTYSGASALAFQPDGKIVIAGGAASVTLDDDFLIIRLNTDGSLDNTFGSSGMVSVRFTAGNDIGYALALQPNGKIVIAGQTNGNYVCMARLLTDGEPDSSFGTNGLVIISSHAGAANSVAIMSDSRIVIGCEEAPVAFMAIRCLSDGTLDTSFNHTGVASSNAGTGGFNYCTAMQLQPDNKIVLAGSGTFGTGSSDFTLIRYDTDGTLDRSFGDTGVTNVDFNGNDDNATALYLEPGGKFVVAGYAIVTINENFALSRINNNGGIDSAFGNNGRITTAIQDSNDRSLTVTGQPDGKIILAGWSYNSSRMGVGHDPTLARYLDNTVSVPNIVNIDDHFLCPNPTTGTLNIKGTITHIISITASDILGNQIPVNTDLPNHEIFTGNIANGVYFFKISSDDHPPDVQKIIIQNK